jgi:hypothetical protein
MGPNYEGLPAAATVEQAIILAQRLIQKEHERRVQAAQNIQRFLKELAQRPAA